MPGSPDKGFITKSSKVQPKLRLIASCSREENVNRAGQSAAVAVMGQAGPEAPVSAAALVTAGASRRRAGLRVRRPEARPVDDVFVNVFIETQDIGGDLPEGLGDSASRANLVAATVPLSRLEAIAEHPRVLQVELGDPIASPTPEISHQDVSTPDPSRWRFGDRSAHGDGEGVLIGIIDVQGFDFAHPDFLAADGTTRFVRIWDQGGDARPSPHAQDAARFGPPLDFGAEFRQEHLNQALQAATALRVPPQEIERQSQMAPSSHGTHVASIAAGNHGVCRQAMIAGVLIALPDADTDRRKSFYDSTRIALAVDYLFLLADELGVPVSINISLGTNGHAHDGTAAISRWIDAALVVPGRSVCVAAGNAGQEVATFPGDLGYVSGRIHTSGKVPGRYLHKDIEWEVVGNGIADVSENELEIWYAAPDRFAVSVRPPGEDSDWIGPVEPRQFIRNHSLATGGLVSIFNDLYHPSNGSNTITVYLGPTPVPEEDTDVIASVVGVPAGRWLVRLHGRDVRGGGYHGWIERDDPRRLGRIGPKEAWLFPSFFSEASNVDESSIGTLACGRRVIAVANLNESLELVNITSSQGPTRDNRCKPDVAAAGTDIVAANGFAGPDDLWVKMTGTSMSSPFVAGVVGLALAIKPREAGPRPALGSPRLTAAQIEGILHRTSRPLPGQSFAWANDAGFGVIQPAACLEEAAVAISEPVEVTP